MLKIKDNVNLKELEKFGFRKKDNGGYDYIREIEGKLVYRVYTTLRHKYIQIEMYETCTIASSLQVLLYNLFKADMVVKE